MVGEKVTPGDRAAVAQLGGEERLAGKALVTGEPRLDTAHEERLRCEWRFARRIHQHRERGRADRPPSPGRGSNAGQSRPKLRLRMARPGGERALRAHFGELGDECVADDHHRDEQSGGDRNDGSA